MNLRTGTRLFLVRERQRAGDFQAFLEHLHWHYRGWHVALLLDEDSSHTAEASRSLADDYEIELLWLPKRSPHLNPMDHLWRHGKEVMSANRQYDSIDEQVDRFIGYLSDLPAREALRKAGALSERFWLRM
jgi:transposase